MLLATGVRLAYLAELRATPWWQQLVVDPQFYDEWAGRIAAGDWLGTRASCILTMLLGRRAGGRVVGLIAGLGLALYEPDVFHTGELDKTSLSVLLVTACVYLFATAGARRGRAAGAGILLGLAALTRANVLVFAPLGMLALAVGWSTAAGAAATGSMARDGPDARTRRASALAFALGCAAVLAPVAWRNHHVSGEWILTTTQLGQNFYTGNNAENPYGAYGVVSFVRANPHFEEADFRAAAEARAGHPLGPTATSAFWLRAGLAHIAADPGFALRAFARKAALFWNHFEISDSQDQYLLERDARVLRLPLLGFGHVAALAAFGAAACAGRSRIVRLLVAFVVVYAATLVAFFLFGRYRVQVVPALLVLAALGLAELGRRVLHRDVRGSAIGLVVVVIAGAASFRTIGIFSAGHPTVVEMRLRHLADAYMTAGDPDRAIAALEEAIPNCTHGCPWALEDLFAVYRRTGRTAEGITYFEAFVRAHPEQRDAPGYLAQLRAVAGKP